MNKVINTIAILLLLSAMGCKNNTQKSRNFEATHINFMRALSDLQQKSRASLADSVIIDSANINAEIIKIKNNYKQIADSLKKANSPYYAPFAVQRYIALRYNEASLKQPQLYTDSIFYILSTYSDIIKNDSITQQKIAKCIVNSLEIGPLQSEDSMISEVVRTAKKHIHTLYGTDASIAEQKKIADLYASQYYNRGIISMAEPVFKGFKNLYTSKKLEAKPIKFDEDYTIYTKKGVPSGNTINKIHGSKVMVFMRPSNNYNLIYLIRILRELSDNYNNMVILARNKDANTDAYIKALGRNLAFDINYINLNPEDIKYYADAPQFAVLDANNSVLYSSNNAAGFLEWLRSSTKKP